MSQVTATARVTTRIGDTGYTTVLGKGLMPKYDPRVGLIGTLDEASSARGLGYATSALPEVRDSIQRLQWSLYLAMAELAMPGSRPGETDLKIGAETVADLEAQGEELKAHVVIGRTFVVPGGTQAGAALDLARTIIRRAERQAAKLFHDSVIGNPELVRFMNRLSDLVFILARFEEAKAGSPLAGAGQGPSGR